MLSFADEYFVARLDERLAYSERGQIERMSSSGSEDNFLTLSGMDEFSHRIAGVFISLRSLRSNAVHGPVKIGGGIGSAVSPAVNYRARTERGGRVVEIHKRLAVNAPSELGKFVAKFLDRHSLTSPRPGPVGRTI